MDTFPTHKHYTWLLDYYWLYASCCTFHPRDYSELPICTSLLLLVHPSPQHPPTWQLSKCSLYLKSVSVLLVLFSYSIIDNYRYLLPFYSSYFIIFFSFFLLPSPSSSSRRPFNISCNTSWVVMSSFSFSLSGRSLTALQF